MNVRDKLKELKPHDLNCNVFDVYSYNGLSMQELLCQFFTKINECVGVSNDTLDLVQWLVNEGLKEEVAKKLLLWYEDGTLEELINVTLFENLNKKIDIVKTTLKNHVSLDNYVEYVTDINTDNECWAEAFNQAVKDLEQTGGVINCIGREYKFKKGISINSNIKINGIKNTTIFKYTGEFDFITLNNMTSLKDIKIVGLGKNNNQIGLYIKSWNGLVENCEIQNFNKGILSRGVLVNIDKCYIHDNGIGIEIDQLIKDNNTRIFSTMINIKDCLIHYNNVGVFSDGDGDSDRDCVMFSLEHCAIEHNDYGLKLPAVMLGSIKKCWFEQNKNNSEVKPWGFVLEQNRFEGTDKIKWIKGTWDDWKSNQITQIESSGIKVKSLSLQRFEPYDNSIVDYNLFVNNSGDLEFNGNYIPQTPSNGTIMKYLKTYYILINKDTVRATNLPLDSYTFEKIETGKYLLALNRGYAFYCPIINVDVINNLNGRPVYYSLQGANGVDEADYRDYFTLNRIAINCFNAETDELVDGTVMMTIHCSKLETDYGI